MTSIIYTVFFVGLFRFSDACDATSRGIHTFGPDCQYMCHCVDGVACNVSTGACSNGCEAGWYGPGCQFRDLAYKELITRHSSNIQSPKYAYLGNDGKSTTCSYTNNASYSTTEPWWRVWLPRNETIHELTILTNDGGKGYFSSFTVTVEYVPQNEKDNNSYTPDNRKVCHQTSNTDTESTLIHIGCGQPLSGNQIRIQLNQINAQLILCDVRIIGESSGRNFAFGSVVKASVTENTQYGARNAVDGDLTNTSLGFCYSSNYAHNRFLEVDLGLEVHVTFVNIIEFDDEHLLKYVIQKRTYPTWTAVYKDRPNDPPTKQVSLNVTVRYIRIKRYPKRLRVCELQIFGNCPPNKCGYGCTEDCHCRELETLENQINGVCSTGCDDRWTGLDAKCNTKCANNQWGKTCTNDCGACKDSNCDVNTGNCPGGCQTGYYESDMCTKACQNKTWGINCTNTCGNCLDELCNASNGVCTSGCISGYKHTSHCKEVCGNGTWGIKCNKTCGGCLSGECNVSDGFCESGCASGFKSTPQCSEECDNGRYGMNCSGKCSVHCSDTCSKVDGTCSQCYPGWTGDLCEAECDNGTWGDGCNGTCGSCNGGTCNETDGTCKSGCSSGYRDTPLCTEECKNGTWGFDCNNTCGNCLNSTCDKSDGKCEFGCIDGYQDMPLCFEECENGTWGNACSTTCGSCLNGTCNKTDGTCDSGCSSGYQDTPLCTDECENRTWGYNCSNTCGNCLNGACNTPDGTCESGCIDGYEDTPLCLEACQIGYYGQNCEQTCNSNCKDKLCHHVNGSCTNRCTAGWQGELCDQACVNGRYGMDCKTPCNVNCHDSCDKVDGHCNKCNAGWNGTLCDTECYNGTYGDGCALVCGKCKDSVACHKMNGSCTVGCATGYEGSLCNVLTEPLVSGFPGAVVGGSVSAIFVIAIVAVGVIFVLRKKHLSSKSKGSASSLRDIGLDDVCSEGGDTGEQLKIKKADSQNDEYYAFEGDETLGNQPRAIVLKELAEFVKTRLAKKKFFDKEFQDIPYGLQFPTTEARKEHNAGKNRYKAMYAYDHTRVVLSTLPSNPNSDYINANYIKGYQKEKAYIATQGPSEVNVNDFWRMVWENNVQLIAMVTKLVENTKLKCIQYWEAVDNSKEYGEITVCTESEEIFAEFIIRRFKLSKQGGTMSRSIVQYAYTAWPDKDVPSNTCSLLHFWNKVRKNDENKTHPWLVHCSAGVGRTGTFIALDILYDQGTDSGYVDINMCVRNLREQRVNMVQKEAQYAFLYRIMVEALVLPSSPVQLSEFDPWYTEQLEFDKTTGKTNLMLEFEGMDEDSVFVTSTDDKEHEDNDCVYANTQVDENKDKNRYSNILAADEFRPFLSSNVPGTNNYINAVYMPSYNDLHGYLMTQTPLPDTAVDCCRLIIEQEIHVIVTFDDDGDNQIGVYLPSNGPIEVGPFKVTLTSKEEEEGYMIQKYRLVYKSKEHTVIQYIYKKWSTYTIVPEEPNHVLEFIHKVDEQDRQFGNKPTLIQCINGAERSGLFVVLMNVIERARMDEEVSIPQVIRYLRTRRHQIVPNYDQYKFCHDVILCYAESNSTYANM